jgi:Xaa-Pro aminopeptidase
VDHVARRARLIRRFDDLGVEAFISSHLPNIRYLSGFTGSNGHVLVHRDSSTFLTDGRYSEQSRREVPDMDRRSYVGDPSVALVAACGVAGVTRVAVEPDHLSYQVWADVANAGPG